MCGLHKYHVHIFCLNYFPSWKILESWKQAGCAYTVLSYRYLMPKPNVPCVTKTVRMATPQYMLSCAAQYCFDSKLKMSTFAVASCAKEIYFPVCRLACCTARLVALKHLFKTQLIFSKQYESCAITNNDNTTADLSQDRVASHRSCKFLSIFLTWSHIVQHSHGVRAWVGQKHSVRTWHLSLVKNGLLVSFAFLTKIRFVTFSKW